MGYWLPGISESAFFAIKDIEDGSDDGQPQQGAEDSRDYPREVCLVEEIGVNSVDACVDEHIEGD